MKNVAKGFFLTAMGVVLLSGVLFLIYSILILVSAIFSVYSYQNSGSLEPTRDVVGGYSSEDVESLWLSNPAVESYRLKITDTSGKKAYGKEFYEVDYDLTIKLNRGYTYNDRNALISAAQISIWNTRDKAPEGDVKIAILSPEDENLYSQSTTDELENSLGPWTGGELPSLDGLFRQFQNPNDKSTENAITDDSSIEVYHMRYAREDEATRTLSCVFVNLEFKENKLQEFYDEPLTIELRQGQEPLKTITIKREDFKEKDFLERFCYDEVWDLKEVSGLMTWPEKEYFRDGKLQAWIDTNRGESMDKNRNLRGNGINLLTRELGRK